MRRFWIFDFGFWIEETPRPILVKVRYATTIESLNQQPDAHRIPTIKNPKSKI